MKDNQEKNPESTENDEETVADVFETLSDKQKKAVYAIVTAALEDDGDDDSGLFSRQRLDILSKKWYADNDQTNRCPKHESLSWTDLSFLPL